MREQFQDQIRDDMDDKYKDRRVDYGYHLHGMCAMDCPFCIEEKDRLAEQMEHWWQQQDQDEEWINAG